MPWAKLDDAPYAFPRRQGLPWLEDLAPPWPGRVQAFRTVFACPVTCPPQYYFPRANPLLRAWLAQRYGARFTTLPPPRHPARPRLAFISRKPNGTRHISNAGQLLAAARAEGWSTETVALWRRCGYADGIAELNAAHVVAGFHGADLGFADVVMRAGSVLVEVIPTTYANLTWFVRPALAGGTHVLRWIIPHTWMKYSCEGGGAGKTEAERRWCTTDPRMLPGVWRKLPSTTHLPLDDWIRLLRLANASLGE